MSAYPASNPCNAALSRPATFNELRSNLPGASAAFVLAQLEGHATLDQARAAFHRGGDKLGSSALKARLADARAQLETGIAQHMQAYPGTARHEAAQSVMSKRPQLRLALVRDVNLKMGRHRQAADVQRELDQLS